ncbi:alpha/beta fold hydrolase [Pleomorphomonas oryzae]|uniref:alpha/beta fold hydrolase n=1 Tax=Pleomorphomonas oryzae TaxID=261934 RepID=UPI000407E78A|nr:alpha/beta hydrolase [Pleomorphomonas oryzae]
MVLGLGPEGARDGHGAPYLGRRAFFQGNAGDFRQRGGAVDLDEPGFGGGMGGPRKAGDGTPSPFGMVRRAEGLLGSLPEPAALPGWLEEETFERLVETFRRTGFTGGLNYYRNLDRNWELQQAWSGAKVGVPALFLIGERDTGLAIPGMAEIIAAMPDLVPDLRGSHILPGAGHWLQQERPAEVTERILAFLGSLGA